MLILDRLIIALLDNDIQHTCCVWVQHCNSIRLIDITSQCVGRT